MREQFIFSLQELRYLRLACKNPKCGTVVVLDLMSKVKPMSDPERKTATPDRCPSCESLFDSVETSSIEAFRRAYQDLSTRDIKITFQSTLDRSPDKTLNALP